MFVQKNPSAFCHALILKLKIINFFPILNSEGHEPVQMKAFTFSCMLAA